MSSNSELTPAQETVIRTYYSYCQNIMNMAFLVSSVLSQGSTGGSTQFMSSSQFSMQQQPSVPQNQNAQMTDPTLPGTSMG